MGVTAGILLELLELVAFLLGSAGFSLTGLYIEQFALASARSGSTVVAVWATVLGGVALLMAYLLATDKAADRYASLRRGLAESTE